MPNKILELNNVHKNFGGLVAVGGVSFSLGSGEMVGLLGPNGSGKSTVLNLISGALPVSDGHIQLSGKSITNLPANKISHRGVSRTFQLVKLAPSISIIENVKLSIAFSNNPLWGKSAEILAEEKLELVGLSNLKKTSVIDLNYIDQKRVELARAIASNPELLLLDEWLSGLNPSELKTGIDLIQKLCDTGITILLVEHIMDAVRALCNRCIVMSSGQIIADGLTDQVLAQDNVIKAYLGDDNA